MTTCMPHRFMLNSCWKSAFQLFTGDILDFGVMLKVHLLVCQYEVRSQLLDTTWRWRCVSMPRWDGNNPAGSQTLCQINLQAKFGGPKAWECVGHLTASFTGSTMMASLASFYIYVLLDFSLAAFSPLPQTIETFVLGSPQRWLRLKAA